MSHCDRCKLFYNMISSCNKCDCKLCDLCWTILHFNEKLKEHDKLPFVPLSLSPILPKHESHITYCNKEEHEGLPCNIVCFNRECKEKLFCGICAIENHSGHKMSKLSSFVERIKENSINSRYNILKELNETKEKIVKLEKLLENEDLNLNDINSALVVKNIDKYMNPTFYNGKLILQDSIDVEKIIIKEEKITTYITSNSVNIKKAEKILLILISAYGTYKGNMCFYILDANVTDVFKTKFINPEPFGDYNGTQLTVTKPTDQKCIDLLAKLTSHIKYDSEKKGFTINGNANYGITTGVFVMIPIEYN